jgi:hypothetical protein
MIISNNNESPDLAIGFLAKPRFADVRVILRALSLSFDAGRLSPEHHEYTADFPEPVINR